MNYPDPINADCCYPTEQDCEQGLILGYDHDGRWKFMSPFGFKMRELRWWLRVPPKPPETEPQAWEKGWQWWLENNRRADADMGSFKAGVDWAINSFKAGWEAGKRDAALLKGKCDE